MQELNICCKIFLLVQLILHAATVSAQDSLALTGKLVDPETQHPLEGVNVFLDQPKIFQLTESDGTFNIKGLKEGQYHLHFNYQDYETIHIDHYLSDSTQDLGVIELAAKNHRVPTVILEDNYFRSKDRTDSQSSEQFSRDYLDKNVGSTLVNTLEKIPGITSLNTGVGVAKPVIRGLTFNRVIVNDKGIKQEGQQWGADHGLEIDQFDVNHLELIKGPGSLLYGSDALGGVINILPTPSPHINSLSGSFTGLMRTNNDLWGASLMLEANKNNYLIRGRYTEQHFGDYKVPADTFTYNGFLLPIEDKQLKNTAGYERDISGMVGMIKKWGTVRLNVSNFFQEVGFFPGAIGIPRAYQLTDDGDRRNIDLPNQQVNHFKLSGNAKVFFERHYLTVDAGFQDNSRKESSFPHLHGYGPSPEGTLAHGLNLKTLTLNTRYFHFWDQHISSVFGISNQVMQNKRSGFEFLIPDYRSFNTGAYSTIKWEIEHRIAVSGGIRLDYGSLKSDSFLQPVYASEDSISHYLNLSPSVNRNFLNYSYAAGLSYYPSESLNLKANLGRTFRIPTIPELAQNGVHHGTFRHEKGDSTLNSEKGYQLDLGIVFQKNQLFLKGSPFFNYFDNYLYLKPAAEFSPLPDAGQIYQYTQNSVLHSGGEILVEYQLTDQLRIGSGFEYVWNYNLDTYLPLPFTPPASVKFEANFNLDTLGSLLKETYVSAEFNYFFAQNRVDRNEASTKGYELIHLKMGAKIPFKYNSVILTFSVRNLLNKHYLNHLSRYRILNLPEQGRNFQFGIKIPFGNKLP